MAQATEESTTVSNIADALQRGDVDGTLKAVGLPKRGFLAGLAALVPRAATASAATAAPAGDEQILARIAEHK